VIFQSAGVSIERSVRGSGAAFFFAVCLLFQGKYGCFNSVFCLPCSEKNSGIISVPVELLCKNDVFFISIIFGLTSYGEQERLFLSNSPQVVGLFFLM